MIPSNSNKRTSTTAAAVFAMALTVAPAANAFAPANRPACASSPTTSTSLFAEQQEQQQEITSSRRQMLQTSMGALFAGLAGAAVGPQEASASYSAYTAREKDWQTRGEAGDIKISTARDLRNQLREIVPQNSEGSKIFCPNGPSAAVSPLMENKCGDRMATASVFGRTEDSVGNSVPGFAGGKYPGVGGGSISAASADTGGFPAYGEVGATPGRKNQQLLN